VSEIDSSLSPVKSDYTDKNAEVWNRDDADIIQEEPRRGTGLFDNPDPENFSHLQLSLSDLDEASFIEINKMSTYQVSISTTFYVRIFHMKVLCPAFL